MLGQDHRQIFITKIEDVNTKLNNVNIIPLFNQIKITVSFKKTQFILQVLTFQVEIL